MASVYTHRLTWHESIMLRHENPDIRRWWRGQFLERVAAEGRARGKSDWIVYSRKN